MLKSIARDRLSELEQRFETLYGDLSARCLARLNMMVGRYGVGLNPNRSQSLWDETSSLLITYGDMVRSKHDTPLYTLRHFLLRHVRDAIQSVHVLPFTPYSSDDGFSVIDYRTVDPELGTWTDIRGLSTDYRFMADLVINHVSRQSSWFKDFTINVAPACNYFIELPPDTDMRTVVRPRTSPLLTPVHTRSGERYVWTTFSDDQIDVNFENPDVLFEYLDILFYYISMGAKIIRLDAIAFLWKKLGGPCIHLRETHEVVKIIRDVLDLVAPEVVLLTETNVPHKENVSYFGDGDEAHIVYQFSMPPLVLHALLNGNAYYLTQWAMQLEAPPFGCTFLNFTASHDGVGVRPLEGLVPDEEVHALVEAVKARGGRVSCKSNPDGSMSPYELNITYFDALSEPMKAPGAEHIQRFLCSQTIPLSFKGVPAIYFHSLTSTPNWQDGVAETCRARTINRRKWKEDELETLLRDKETPTAQVFDEYIRRLNIRKQHCAFHPDSDQTVHSFSDDVFILERVSASEASAVAALHNVTNKTVTLDAQYKLPTLHSRKEAFDLISGQSMQTNEITLQPYQCVWLIAESMRT